MYQNINNHAGAICGDSALSRAVMQYKHLLGQLSVVDVIADGHFRRECEAFWRITAGHVGEEWREHFFRILDECKRNRNTDVAAITMSLASVPRNKSGSRALDFSFASKLVHMIDPTAPIYDALIAAFYFFDAPSSGSITVRLPEMCEFYDFLRREYQRVKDQRLLGDALSEFRRTHSAARRFTDEKVIDFLIWTYVRLLRSGAQRHDSRLLFA